MHCISRVNVLCKALTHDFAHPGKTPLTHHIPPTQIRKKIIPLKMHMRNIGFTVNEL